MRFRSLRGKFLVLYLGILSGTFLILAMILPTIIQNYFKEQKYSILLEETKVLTKQIAVSYFTGDQSVLDSQMQVFDKALDTRIWVYDFVNNVKKRTGPDPVNENWQESEEFQLIFNKAKEGHAVQQEGNLGGYFSETVLTVGAPIMFTDKVVGILFLHASLAEVSRTVDDIYSIILMCLFISIIVAFLLILVLTEKIIIPLNQMNVSAKAIANGDFTQKVYIDSDDEVGQLANTFNYMSEELCKLEELRKSFIENISHDFRSPLTSIHGFVQAIQDGTIPYEMQGKYLNIVLGETDRLTKMTNDLLDLTKMEHGEELTLTDFDIQEMIRKLIIGFEQRIIKKSVEVQLLFIDDYLYVLADIDKIQRVVYNLLDNALKFVEDGGEIIIETTVISKKASISIKDTGQGIEKDSLKYIFDRFHKGDKSRGKDKKGTGLGLAIVKKIIVDHGEEINVESVVNEGTTFTFTLPYVKKHKIKE